MVFLVCGLLQSCTRTVAFAFSIWRGLTSLKHHCLKKISSFSEASVEDVNSMSGNTLEIFASISAVVFEITKKTGGAKSAPPRSGAQVSISFGGVQVPC